MCFYYRDKYVGGMSKSHSPHPPLRFFCFFYISFFDNKAWLVRGEGGRSLPPLTPILPYLFFTYHHTLPYLTLLLLSLAFGLSHFTLEISPWKSLERPLKYSWKVFERFLKDFWNIPLKDSWKIFEIFPWKTLEASLERFLKGFWNILERFLKYLWQCIGGGYLLC
jgi:hypothetical protein